MKTVAVTPVLGEFGFITFDVQPQIRAWLRSRQAERKVVFAPRELSAFFEEATEVIEPPPEMLPSAPATMRSIAYPCWVSGHPERIKVEKLVAWAKDNVRADEWLDIPYFDRGPWTAPATYVKLQSRLPRPTEPYVVVAARARPFDSWRNWPTGHWDELVLRIRSEWNIEVRAIGRPPATYFPHGVVPQEVDNLDRLDHTICLLNHAVCSISSNSGPTHLSLMTGCPTFAWGDAHVKPLMEVQTNPLQTPCAVFTGGWDPDVDSVWDQLAAFRRRLEDQGLWQRRLSPSAKCSMCMIARDSSRTISAALESIRPWVDELIVVDTGSTDETPRIASAHGAKVFHATWPDSFAEARNVSLSHATGEWLLWMDSDDTISPESGLALRELVSQHHNPAIMGFVMQVHCPAGQEGNGYATPTVVDHIKLFRNIPALRFTGRIHEQILPAIRRLGGDVAWTQIHAIHSGADQSPEGRRRKHARDLRLLQLELGENPDSTFALFNLGMTLLDAGQAEEALYPLCRSLQLAFRGESHVRKIYALLVQAYVALGRTEPALKTCHIGLEVVPDDPELLFRRGTLEQALGRLHDAEATYLHLLTRAHSSHFGSADKGIMGIKAWHNLALVYEGQGKLDATLAAWKRVLASSPNNAVAWRGVIDAAVELGSQGKMDTLASLINDPATPSNYRLLASARSLAANQQSTEALQALVPLAFEPLATEFLRDYCEIAFNAGKWTEAIQGLEELAGRRPQEVSVWTNLGMAYLQCQRYRQAGDAVKRALIINARHVPALQILLAIERSTETSTVNTE